MRSRSSHNSFWHSHTHTFSFHIHIFLLSHTYILLTHTYISTLTHLHSPFTYIHSSLTHIYSPFTYIYFLQTYIHSIYMYVKGEYMCVREKNVCTCKENVCMWEREYSGNGRQIASTLGPILAEMRRCRARLSLGIGEKIMGQSRADYKTLLADRWLFSMGKSRLKAVVRAAGLVCSCVYLSSARVSFVSGWPLLEWRRSAAWEKYLEVNFKSWGAFGGTVLKRNTSAAKE